MIHLGAPRYNEKTGEYEPYFWVYIDNIDTGIKITSTGSDKTDYVIILYPSR